MKKANYSQLEKYKILYKLITYPMYFSDARAEYLTTERLRHRRHKTHYTILEKFDLGDELVTFKEDLKDYIDGKPNKVHIDLFKLDFNDDRFHIDDNGEVALNIGTSLDALNSLRKVCGLDEYPKKK